VRERVTGLVRELLGGLEEGAADIAQRVAESIVEDEPGLELQPKPGTSLDVERFWSDRRQRDLFVSAQAGLGLAGLRGAQSGIYLVSMFSGLAGLALSTTAVLGVGAFFGGKQLWDERKRRVAMRRQQVRGVVRQFLDDVQFEAGKASRDVVRELQRQQRDFFANKIAERLRTQAAALEAAQRASDSNVANRKARAEQLRAMLSAIDGLVAVTRQQREAT
jgi:hypothetical protein